MNDSIIIKKLMVSQRKKIYILITILLFSAIIDSIQPLISSYIIDNALKNFNYSRLLLYLGILVLVHIIGILIGYIQSILTAKVEENLKYDIKLKIFKSLLNHKLDFYKEKDVGELMARMLNEAPEMIKILLTSIMSAIMGVIYIIVLIIAMFSLNSVVAIVNVIFGIIVFCIMMELSVKINEGQTKIITKHSGISNEVNEGIYNIKTIKYLGIQNYILNKVDKILKDYCDINIKYNKLIAIVNIILGLCVFIPNIFLWVYGGYLIGKNIITVGTVIALASYFQKFISTLDKFKTINVEIEKLKVILGRLKEIVNECSDEVYCGYALEENIAEVNKLSLVNISGGYNRNIFTNLNMSFNKGEIIKISGKNATGKTTLINLITGITQINSGNIYINDMKINSVENIIRESDLFGIVPQDIQLFSGKVKDNICLNKQYDDNQILSLVDEIGIEGIDLEFLEKRVLSRGINLSGGQKQKIALIRSLIKNPKILILDEATSNLDSISKNALYEYIYKSRFNKITIVIAHDDFDKFTREVKLSDYI